MLFRRQPPVPDALLAQQQARGLAGRGDEGKGESAGALTTDLGRRLAGPLQHDPAHAADRQRHAHPRQRRERLAQNHPAEQRREDGRRGHDEHGHPRSDADEGGEQGQVAQAQADQPGQGQVQHLPTLGRRDPRAEQQAVRDAEQDDRHPDPNGVDGRGTEAFAGGREEQRRERPQERRGDARRGTDVRGEGAAVQHGTTNLRGAPAGGAAESRTHSASAARWRYRPGSMTRSMAAVSRRPPRNSLTAFTVAWGCLMVSL